jgi:hypothetical protein
MCFSTWWSWYKRCPVCQHIQSTPVPTSKSCSQRFLDFFWGGVGQTQAWMPTYVSILRIPQMIWVWRVTVEWYWQGKTEELGEKPVPVPLCPPQIQHGFTRPIFLLLFALKVPNLIPGCHQCSPAPCHVICASKRLSHLHCRPAWSSSRILSVILFFSSSCVLEKGS